METRGNLEKLSEGKVHILTRSATSECCLLLLLLFEMLLGFCGLVFWKAIYISTLVYFISPLQCQIGITTSSAKKLPHRVVTLKSIDKGEEEMVFQYRGYGS